MAVAHVTSSQSHASGANSVSQASFNWTHTTTTNPQGVLVLVFQGVSATDAVTSVTYDGVTVPAVSGGRATDTATEPGSVAAYFLGSSVPTTDNPTVVVNRTNNTTTMWAVCVTVTAAVNTEVVGTVLTQENGAVAEQSVDDGSPGVDSVRYAGVYYGGATPAPAGTNSTLLGTTNDAGAYGWTAVRETTAGQGARSVGCTQATSDDRAGVHLAIREVVPPAFPITVRQTGNNGATAATSLTTSSATPTADSLFIVAYGAEMDAFGTENLPSFTAGPSGGSLSYTLIAKDGDATASAHLWGSSNGFWIGGAAFRSAIGGSPSAFTVTVDANATANCFHSALCFDITGHNASTPIVQSKAVGGTINPESNGPHNVSVVMDAAPTDGNLLVLCVFAGADGGGGFSGIEAGSGKTLAAVSNPGAGSCQIGAFSRECNGTESATITISDLGQTVGNWSAVAFEVAASSGGNANITASAVSAVAGVPAATVQGGSVVTPAAVSAVASIPAAIAQAGAVVAAVAVAAVAGVPAATVSGDGNANISASTVNAVAAIPSPVMQAGSTVIASAVAAASAVPAATVRLSAAITPAATQGLVAIPGPVLQTGSTVVAVAVHGQAAIPAATVQTHKYVADVSSNGRYFLDQDGAPILVRGESPWAMFTKLSSSEMDTYLGNRAGYGCNLALVSMIGAVANGAPADTGATYDGILPFVSGDPTQFNSTYWSRMDSYIAKARDLGITLMIYPMDGWNTAFASVVFNPGSISNAQCQTYGQTLATRYLSYPNIIWNFGGDYNEDSTINDRFNACLTGIRAAGDNRIASIQLLYETSESSNSSFWETKVDFNWVYTYYVTYKGMKDGYDHTWTTSPTTRPAMFCEGAYENSGSPHPGSDAALRRQACWALTCGSPGELTGQEGVWNFQASWATLLDTTAADQIKAIRDTFEGVNWWTLVPDDSSQLVTAGRGTRVTTDSATFPLDNTFVTAARAADGTLAVIYIPNADNAITVDMTKIGANPTATWVDPCTGATTAATVGSTYQRITNNNAGDSDWLLILTGDAGVTVTPSTVTGTASIPAPAVQVGSTVASVAVASVASVPAPAVQTGSTVSAASVTSVAAVPAAAVVSGSGSTAAPGTVAAVAAIPSPTIRLGVAIAATSVASASSIPAPIVSAGMLVSALSVTATAVIPLPTVASIVAGSASGAVGQAPSASGVSMSVPTSTPPGD